MEETQIGSIFTYSITCLFFFHKPLQGHLPTHFPITLPLLQDGNSFLKGLFSLNLGFFSDFSLFSRAHVRTEMKKAGKQ